MTGSFVPIAATKLLALGNMNHLKAHAVEYYGVDFHVKVAETLEDACKLLETGFEYVTDMEGKKLFRKRK